MELLLSTESSQKPPTGAGGLWEKVQIVEARGIEPLSFGFSTGLLRAQPAEDLGRPLVAGVGDRPSQVRCPRPVT